MLSFGRHYTLASFVQFTGCVLAATMPISSGVFGPCLVIGNRTSFYFALLFFSFHSHIHCLVIPGMGIGRAVGEFVQTCYPYGLAYFSSDLAPSIIPATYAIAGLLLCYIAN